MTSIGLSFFNYNNQYQVSNMGSSSAVAMSSPSGAMAYAGSGNIMNSFNQLNNVAGQQQNPFMQMMQSMMQMMMQLMQMFMQMLGMNQNQQQNQNNAYANAGTNNAYANAGANNATAMANASSPYNFVSPNASTAAAYSTGSPSTGTPLSQIPANELDAIKGDDLNAAGKKNANKYVFYNGHLYKESGKNHYKSVVKLKKGLNNLYLSKNAKIQQGSAGGFSAAMAASSNGYSGAAAMAISQCPPSVATVTSKERTGSPLILDTNKDGQVSATQGKGVDVDGDGKADGAATGGDKMLAMGDLDGDGKITGKEVFGNETIDPFTGQKLNAKDGFDALNKVAKSAEAHTGKKCMDENGNVDVQKLKQILEESGKGSLGMISDDNNTQLEGLGDVATINTTNYKTQQQTGAVQHNQLGSYTDTSGKTQKVDDVWFQLA